MPKGTECDGRITKVGEIREHDLENGDVSNDRRRDGGDKEEDGCNEDEGHADPIQVSDVSCAFATNRSEGKTNQWIMRAIATFEIQYDL
jgi:hypothetical protein